jgi:hypothetical protein
VRKSFFCALIGLLLAGVAAAQTGMNEPDDTKPVHVTGCMSARTQSGGFILSGVFGPPITVVGPNYLQAGLGHEVTLTGTWQTNGISTKNNRPDTMKMFIATAVKITARQCASPPSAPAPPAKNSGTR